MKVTETQIRQVIKEEIQNVLNEMHDEQEPSLGLTGGKLAGMVGGAISANVLFKAFEKAIHENPEFKQAIIDAITSSSEVVQNAGHAVSSMFESKKRK